MSKKRTKEEQEEVDAVREKNMVEFLIKLKETYPRKNPYLSAEALKKTFFLRNRYRCIKKNYERILKAAGWEYEKLSEIPRYVNSIQKELESL